MTEVPEQEEQQFTGAHPTAREFVDLMLRWGFTQRRGDDVHRVFRGPHGGTVRVLRSLVGRADTELVDKAARFAGITTATFWAGPGTTNDDPDVAAEGRGVGAEPAAAGRPGLATASARRRVAAQPVAATVADLCPQGTTPDSSQPDDQATADLFARAFPDGVHMTAELLADFEAWARLTKRLGHGARAS